MASLFKYIVVAVLTWEARLVLWRYRPKIIAVTGSAGKTSTKDAIFSVLSEKLRVRRSEKSFNSEIGVPLTILDCPNAWGSALGWIKNIVAGLILFVVKRPYPSWLVLEVGADRPGDIKRIAQWLHPDIAVVTSIPDIPVHVEFFRSPDELAKEKRELVANLKRGGKLIVNGDEEKTAALGAEFQSVATSFGFRSHDDFNASHDEVLIEDKKPVGMQFRAHRSGSTMPVIVRGALGRPVVYAALAALAIAETLGITLVSAAASLRRWQPPPGRMRILSGINESVILDDTYNSSPVAATSALETMINAPGFKKRIAVLGDMLELGKYSTDAHKRIGTRVAECAHQLVTIGFRARNIAEAAMDAGMSEKYIRQYDHGESERAGKELENDLAPGTIVLIKGSQSMRMERTVKEIMAEPESAPELLVRQEEEWMSR